jgi:uncharacterized phage-associated protein
LCSEYLRAILPSKVPADTPERFDTPSALRVKKGVEMSPSYRQEKAFNAITYFLEHTAMCNKKKLFKLLWLLDSEHYQAIGRTVTGYHYFAWKMGPVPTELHEAMDSGDPELLERFEIDRTISSRGYTTIWLVSKQQFDPKYFSKKELEILQSVSDRFEMMNGGEMEAYTHREGTPWYRVWEVEQRHQAEIPFEYALDDLPEEERQIVSDLASEQEAFLNNYHELRHGRIRQEVSISERPNN